MEFIYLLFGFASTAISFIAFLFTLGIAFENFSRTLVRLNFRDIAKEARAKPIRTGLAVMSFLMFVSTTLPYVFEVEHTTSLIFRTLANDIPTLIASVVILWVAAHIQSGEWTIYYGKDWKDE